MLVCHAIYLITLVQCFFIFKPRADTSPQDDVAMTDMEGGHNENSVVPPVQSTNSDRLRSCRFVAALGTLIAIGLSFSEVFNLEVSWRRLVGYFGGACAIVLISIWFSIFFTPLWYVCS